MASNPSYCDITPEIGALAAQSLQNSSIDTRDYMRYDIERDFRDLNGKGILVGLTEISGTIIEKMVDGQEIPYDSRSYYHGIGVEKLAAGALKEGRSSFEEAIYLLLLDRLSNATELESFKNQLAYYRILLDNFVRDVTLKAPNQDIINSLAYSALNSVSYNERCDNIPPPSIMRQCLQLITLFPVLNVYGYQAHTYKSGNSLYIHTPQPELSTAENILSLLRPDSSYSFWKAHVLDICLTLHVEHGGGNNFTLTTHMITSSGTDTYSCMATTLASLKGPKHGGADIKVTRIFEDTKEQAKDWKDEDEMRHYLQALLDKQTFDRVGLIYNIGHAVCSLSDPHANLLHPFTKKLSQKRGRTEEYELYPLAKRLGPEIIVGERKMYKDVSTSVDFCSGFVYYMLDLPLELHTPPFAMARVAGWSAHCIEELINMSKTTRPAYKYMETRADYVSIAER